MKHTDEELKQWQALPLSIKELMSKERIRNWVKEYGEDGVYISFSGGKDSTVLKHLVESMGYNVPSVFINTGLEYPEIQKFARAQKNVVTLTPAMRFNEVVLKYGYPVISKPIAKRVEEYRNAERKGQLETSCAYKEFNGIAQGNNGQLSIYNKSKYKFLVYSNFKISHKCCNEMKKKPFKAYEKQTGRKYPFIATMATESLDRRTKWKKYGCNAFDAKHPQSTPLAFWTEQDVLHYIKKYNVPYCSVYGDRNRGWGQPLLRQL